MKNKLFKLAEKFDKKTGFDKYFDEQMKDVKFREGYNKHRKLIKEAEEGRLQKKLAEEEWPGQHYGWPKGTKWVSIDENDESLGQYVSPEMEQNLQDYGNYIGPSDDEEPVTQRMPETSSSDDPRFLTPRDGDVLYKILGQLIAGDLITKDLEYYQGLLEKLNYLKES